MDHLVRGLLAFRAGPGGWPADADSREWKCSHDGCRRPHGPGLAIKGDKIVAVGSDAEIRRLAGPDTSITDLGGRTVIPGVNDTHIHAIRGGQTFRRETYWYDVASLEDALARMKDAAAKRGAGKWVMVAGSWSPAQFTENRAPTVEDLDRILPDNPGYVQYLYDY